MSVVEPGVVSSDLFGRVKRLLLSPSAEWERIDPEPATIKGLYVGYVCILAAIPAIAGLVGGLVFGNGIPGVMVVKPSLTGGVVTALLGYGFSLLLVFAVALIVDGLAKSFDGQSNRIQAFKVSAYSYTATWAAGILYLVPVLGMIGLLLSFYGIYLLYRGLPRLMKAPQEKALGYTVVTVICTVVLSIIVNIVIGAVVGAAILGGAYHAASNGGSMTVGGATVDLGKMEAASRQLEAAAASTKAGKDVPVTSPDVLKGFLPAASGGFARTSLEAHSAGAEGAGMSSAQGDYEKDGRRFSLAVTDLGALAGLTAMASAMNAQTSTETATGYEKTSTAGGRLVSEKWDREAKSGSYSVVVGNRFTIEANGEADSIDQLKSAVAAVDAGKLERLAK